MPTARIPIPAATPAGETPTTAGVRLRRLSGREVPMWLDEGKTLGPIYYGTASQDLWADTGLYELLVQPSPPRGTVYTSSVQVGEGQTPAPDEQTVTFTALEGLLAAERAAMSTRYAGTADTETISGAWNFTTAPTLNGGAFGGGGGVTTSQMDAAIDAALLEELTRADLAYAGVAVAESITGQWDFTVAPTVNGQPIGTGDGAVASIGATALTITEPWTFEEAPSLPPASFGLEVLALTGDRTAETVVHGDGTLRRPATGNASANSLGTLNNPALADDTTGVGARPTGLTYVVWKCAVDPVERQPGDYNLLRGTVAG